MCTYYRGFIGLDLFPAQVASCTLDASAKIYAGRVDAIHADTYKMLGGLGHGDRQSKGIQKPSHQTKTAISCFSQSKADFYSFPFLVLMSTNYRK